MRQAGITPRRDAIEADEDTYVGSPCGKCGKKERFSGSGGCIYCSRSFVPLDEQVALSMWKADKRPCDFGDLSDAEKQEWIIMAKAARKIIMARIDHAILHLKEQSE